MLTNIARSELSRFESARKARRMFNQGRYALRLVLDDAPVAAALGAAFLAEARETLQRLEEALRDRKTASEVSKAATDRVGSVVAAAQVWRRMIVARFRAAVRRGADLPKDAARMGSRGTAPDELVLDLDRLLKDAADYRTALASLAVPADLLQKGAELAAELKQADNEQEHLRGSVLKDAVRHMRELAGLMYVAVKQINDLGLSVHAAELAKAAQYNLEVLRRGHHARPEPDVSPPPETPDAASTAA